MKRPKMANAVKARIVNYPSPRVDPRAFHDFARVVSAEVRTVKKGKPVKYVPRKATKDLNVNSLANDVPKAARPSYDMMRVNSGMRNSATFFSKVVHFVGADISEVPFAEGSYGSLYSAKFSQGYDTSPLTGLYNCVGSPGSIPRGKPVALKIQMIRNTEDIRVCEREARIHAYVNKKHPDISPRSYISGFSPRHGAQITVMEYVGGETLGQLTHITMKQFLDIERRVIGLWMIGITHADLHSKNIIFDAQGIPHIIDFGRAIVIPKSLRPKESAYATKRAFQNTLQKYANAVIFGRRGQNGNYGVFDGYMFTNDAQYSSDVNALRRIFKQFVVRGDRARAKKTASS